MNRKYLKDQGFTQEQIDVIMAEHGRTMAGYVPKSETEALTAQITALKAQTGDLDTLKANAAKAATLEQQLAQLTTEKDTISKQSDAKIKMMQAKVKDPDLFMSKLDLAKELDPQLEALKASHPYMFGDPVPNNPNPNPAGDPNASAFEQEVAAFKAQVDATGF
jgi:DNA-binding transcriptional MerR regulator